MRSVSMPTNLFARQAKMRFSEPSFFIDGLWRFSVFGEFCTLSGFKQENLQFEYTIQHPDRWFQRNHHSQTSAISQKCRVNDQAVAHVCLPFSMDFLVADEPKESKKQAEPKSHDSNGDTENSSPENDALGMVDAPESGKQETAGISWPRLCVRVYGIDMLGRRTLSGIGSAALPQSAGPHVLTICTCRTVSDNHLDQLSEHFLGFVEDADDEEEERDISHSHAQVTESSGTVTVRVNCIRRSEASIEKRKRDRELLSASIEEVVAAFERAKLEMLELRQRVLKEQKEYDVRILRTHL